MKSKKIFLVQKVAIGIVLGIFIVGTAIFGRMAGQNLMADLDINLGGILDGVLGGVGLDISTDGFSFSTGGGVAKQPGCGGSECLVAPNPDAYAGIVITGIDGTTNLRAAILKWTNFFLSFLALIAMIFLIYAGFLYVTSMGNDEQAKKAKNIIIWVVVGIIVIMIAYSLVNTLITTGPTGHDI
ncbi:MAG: hypothetical protein WCV72_01255 [Patescibacteria group bacterium]|jgi:hypothetical protein